MKKMKYIINTSLSIVICLLVVIAIILIFVDCNVFNSTLLIGYFEKNGFYEEKYEYIIQQIDDLMLNAGVEDSFTKSIIPSKDLVKSILDNSVKRFFGSDIESNNELDKYSIVISEKFTKEANRQGLTEENDIAEIRDVYCNDIISIINETARMPGETTVGVYTSRASSLIKKYWIYLAIAVVLISVYFCVINVKSSAFFITVPYISAFMIFITLYLIFKTADFSNFIQPIQKSLIMLADNTLVKCMIASSALLLISIVIYVTNILISKVRGNKSEKK